MTIYRTLETLIVSHDPIPTDAELASFQRQNPRLYAELFTVSYEGGIEPDAALRRVA